MLSGEHLPKYSLPSSVFLLYFTQHLWIFSEESRRCWYQISGVPAGSYDGWFENSIMPEKALEMPQTWYSTATKVWSYAMVLCVKHLTQYLLPSSVFGNVTRRSGVHCFRIEEVVKTRSVAYPYRATTGNLQRVHDFWRTTDMCCESKRESPT